MKDVDIDADTDTTAVTVLDALTEREDETILGDDKDGLKLRDCEPVEESVEDGDTRGCKVNDFEPEADGVMEDDGDGDGDGDGQFCCSNTESSPTGPSSSDPAIADTATHGTVGSHSLMPVLGVPPAVVARAAAMVEKRLTASSRCGWAALGPTSVLLPGTKLYTDTVAVVMVAPKPLWGLDPVRRPTRTDPRVSTPAVPEAGTPRATRLGLIVPGLNTAVLSTPKSSVRTKNSPLSMMALSAAVLSAACQHHTVHSCTLMYTMLHTPSHRGHTHTAHCLSLHGDTASSYAASSTQYRPKPHQPPHGVCPTTGAHSSWVP